MKIAVFSSTRADYGLLKPVLNEIENSAQLEGHLIVTGTHLSTHHGLSVDEIKKDNWSNIHCISMGELSSRSPLELSIAMAGLGEELGMLFDQIQPDLLLLLGDRYELLTVAARAAVFGMPIAHIAGGDQTHGALDDNIRHAISKLAHIHLVTHIEAKNLLLKMNEDESRIYVCGSPGIDLIKQIDLMSKDILEQDLDIELGQKNALITLHPQTLGEFTPKQQINILLDALRDLPKNMGLWFTSSNADPGAEIIDQAITQFVASRPHAALFPSLGSKRYFSFISLCDVVVGNSSSGIYEVPSFQTPTVDIGSRQAGRIRASSVFHVGFDKDQVYRAILKSLKSDCRSSINPYGNGHAAQKIIESILSLPQKEKILQKNIPLTNR